MYEYVSPGSVENKVIEGFWRRQKMMTEKATEQTCGW